MLGFGLSIEPQLWALIFVMVRVGAALVAAPVFGSISVPLPVRITLGRRHRRSRHGCPSPSRLPARSLPWRPSSRLQPKLWLALRSGLIPANRLRGPIHRRRGDRQFDGYRFASMVDPQTGSSSQAIGQFMSVLLTLLFLSLNGHLILVDMVVRSYQALPPGGAWLSADQLKNIAFFGGYTFSAAFSWRCPLAFFCSALTSLSGCSRARPPALNLFAVGLPASLAVGIIALAIAFPAMGDYMIVIINEGLSAASRLVLG